MNDHYIVIIMMLFARILHGFISRIEYVLPLKTRNVSIGY